MVDVSIIVPCYNCSWCIETLAENLRESVPGNAEIVFVDDGSTDDSLENFRSLAPESRCVRQRNSGPGAARNRAVKEARGEYLQLFDADDTIVPGKIEAQLAFAKENRLDVVYSDWRMVVSRGPKRTEGPFMRAEAETEVVEALLGGWWFPPIAALVSKAAFDRVEGCDPALRNTCDDFDLWVRLAISGARYGYLAGHYANYHRYGDRRSISRINRREFLQGEATMIRKAVGILRANGGLSSSRACAAAKRLHQVARGAFELDREWHGRLLREVRELDPNFRPSGSRVYRLAAAVVGLKQVEALALNLRKVRGRIRPA